MKASRRAALRLWPALLLAGCLSPKQRIPPPIPEGVYRLDSKAFYEAGLVRVTGDDRGGLRVTLLDHFGGSFRLAADGDGGFILREARIDIGKDVNRSLRGEGRLTGDGAIEGECVVWIGGTLGITRNHRSQPWSLRPVDPDSAARGLEKLRKRYPGRLEALGL